MYIMKSTAQNQNKLTGSYTLTVIREGTNPDINA